MKIVRFAIENRQFALIMGLLLAIFGLISFMTMPRSEDPAVSPAGSSIIVIYPGAGPEDLETMVVSPLEEALNELEDIHKFRTNIQDGLAIINVEFYSGADPDEKYTDVLQKVNRVRNQLPPEILSLDIIKWSITNVNIIQIALTGDDAGYAVLSDHADRIKKGLEKLYGVKNASTWAYPEEHIEVAVDLEKLAAMAIPLEQVIGAIQSSNSNIPGGSVDLGERKFNIRTSGFFESLDEIENTILHARDGIPVRLRDVATVRRSFDDETYKARLNGKKAVYITAKQKDGTNVIDVINGIHNYIDVYQEKLPDNLSLQYVSDQSKSVSNRIGVFFSNLLQGMILVGIVVLLFFGIKASLVIAFAIPTSILIGIGLSDLTGYGLQQMTIAALVIALGLLVDNAIVVTENISRFIRAGKDPETAAIEGTSQVGYAVISSTVTTVLAFIPMTMISSMTGDFIRSLPMTVVYTLTASLFIALTITPLLAIMALKGKRSKMEERMAGLVERFISGNYRPVLGWALKHRSRVIIITSIVFLGSLGLFPLVGISFFPKAEKPQFMVNVTTPKGSSLAYTDSVVSRVEHTLAGDPFVLDYAASIGRSNPQLYYNVIEKREMSHYGEVFVTLKEWNRDSLYSIIDKMRKRFTDFPGARIEVKEFQQGPPVEAPIAVKVIGDNLDSLKSLSTRIEALIAKSEGTVNVDNPLATSATDLHIRINREKAAMLGIPIVSIDRTVRAAVAGLNISTYRDQEGEDYPVRVRLPHSDRPGYSAFDQIYLTSAAGHPVPLSQIAKLEFKGSPSLISHEKMERNVTIKADVLPGYSVNQVSNEVVAGLKAFDWPQGYSFYLGGEVESQNESFGGMGKAILIAIIAIFGVLVLQFSSYRQPLIIYAAIPLAIIGSILALLVTGYSFSFTAFVGLTSLVGIVINNSIILVDYINKLRKGGMDKLAAVMEAGATRFLPIILTTGTTIGGLLPLTLGGGTLWAPMGWTIIGGLLVSTILTLLLVPVLYMIFSR